MHVSLIQKTRPLSVSYMNGFLCVDPMYCGLKTRAVTEFSDKNRHIYNIISLIVWVKLFSLSNHFTVLLKFLAGWLTSHYLGLWV